MATDGKHRVTCKKIDKKNVSSQERNQRSRYSVKYTQNLEISIHVPTLFVHIWMTCLRAYTSVHTGTVYP